MSAPDITFTYPGALWGLLLLPLIWLVARRRLSAVHIGIRVAIVACVIVALGQPGVSWRSDNGYEVFVLDQKTQLSDAARAQARAMLSRRLAVTPEGWRTIVVQLGGSDSVAGPDTIMVPGASLSSALAAAQAAIPVGAGGKVTVISDGRSSDTDWDRTVAALARREIPVDIVALEPTVTPGFISDIQVAADRPGEALPVTVTVEGTASGLAVDLYLDERQVASSKSFPVDGYRDLSFELTAPAPGFHRLRAVLNGDTDRQLETVVAVQDPARLLYLGEGRSSAASQLRGALGPGFTVDAPNPAALGANVDFTRYAAVVIDDLPAARLSAANQRRLLSAISQDGVGLFFSGGASAFGSGGWKQAPLAAALPVRMKAQERIAKPSVALAVIIDSSGSMEGPRLEIAKQMATLAVRKLTKQDYFGVVEFYGGKQWAVPMQPVSDIDAIERAIGRMEAQGSSVLFPAVQEAYYGIKDIDARFRHILVISDGDVVDGKFETLLRHIAGQRINVSTAVVDGREADMTQMMQWARWGGGRFFSIPDQSGVVQVDLSPPQTTPQRAYRDGPFALRIASGGDWWRSQGIASLPALSGYVPVNPRPAAQTLIAAGNGDVVLNSWQYGSGRVTAFMSQPFGPGTQGWAGWRKYGAWLGRTLLQTAQVSQAQSAALNRDGDDIALSLYRGSDRGAQAPEAWLVDADGQDISRLSLDERAPGLFIAHRPWPSDRDAMVRITDGAGTLRVADPARPDLDAAPLPMRNTLPFAAIAAHTGGRVLDEGATPTPVIGGDIAFRSLWPWLSLLALLLYLTEIGLRRWPGPNGRAILERKR